MTPQEYFATTESVLAANPHLTRSEAYKVAATTLDRSWLTVRQGDMAHRKQSGMPMPRGRPLAYTAPEHNDFETYVRKALATLELAVHNAQARVDVLTNDLEDATLVLVAAEKLRDERRVGLEAVLA